MNTERHPAEERLLDAALAQVLAVREPAVAPRRRHLLAAALVLLGVGVVAATMWSLRQRNDVAVAPEPQEPESAPLPMEVHADGAAALAELPAGTVNLVLATMGPDDLVALRRFPGVRRLALRAKPGIAGAPPAGPTWDAARDLADALRPLADLPMLEVLELPWPLEVQPAQLAPLAGLRHLRSLKFGNAICTPAHADALAVLPALRSLTLLIAAVDAAFLRRLGLAPRPVTELNLEGCPGLDDEAFAALGTLRSLRQLSVSDQDSEGTTSVAGKSYRFRTLGAAAFAAFATLPELRELRLDESAFNGALLAKLPLGLRLLDLGFRPMNGAEAAHLARLTNLRKLTFACGLAPEDAVDVLPSLHLTDLDYRGSLTRELLAAFAAQRGLESLAVRIRSEIDLASLASAPALRVLTLRGQRLDGKVEFTPTLAMLRPLAASTSLQQLSLIDLDLPSDQVAALFGGRPITILTGGTN